MDHTSSSRGHNTFAQLKSEATTADTSSPSTTVTAAAAPESSILAVKLSEDSEGQAEPGNHEVDDSKRSDFDSSRSSLKEGGYHGSRGQSPVVRRSRSGRLLRSTVQYDERSSRGSSPETSAEPQGSFMHRTRSSYHGRIGQSDSEGHPDLDIKGERLSSGNSDNAVNLPSQQEHDTRQRGEYGNTNQDELASEEEHEDDGFPEDGDDVNNEGSESQDASSSKNDDGSEPLVVSMYGSPSLVKVRSMFIDKLYKMVEDPSIQHLISWAKEGDMFYVYNCIELSSSVLPKFFKHNNWQSFVRQLNMYGFHKIYRYDREESTMNRRNPETQRWQFYHPAFQRDRPHLRNNIKRKSARSVNTAPTYSRVVFERDKGYYVQQESSTRPFNGQGSHNRSNNSEHSQEQHRPSHSHGASQAGSIPHHYNPHTSQVHRSPHESLQRPPVPRPDYRPHAGHPGEPIHPRDEKDHMPSNHQIGSPHQHIARVDHDTQHHQQYPGPHYHSQQQHQHQSHPYASPHQHQYSYNGPPSQAHHPSEHGYSHKSQSFNSHNPPPPESHHAGPPLPHTAGTGRLTHQGHGYHSSREPGYPDYSHDVKHGTTMGGGHFRSQSAPGSDPRRVESSRGPHPFNQQEVPRSPPHTGSQPYYSRESYPPPMSPHRRHQGSIDENSGPSRRYSPPPGTGMGLSQPGQQQRPPSGLGAVEEAQLAAPNMDPASNPSSHDLIPHGIKQMESRLHFVEDAYMSLRHFAQELQNIQVSQEQTIAWMRDRIEQLTEVGTPRDMITSPPLGQGMVPSKRKAEYSSVDSRDWPRRPPGEYQSGFSRQANSPGLSPTQQERQIGGPDTISSRTQGSGARYESSGFHPSFHPAHHPSQPQQPTPPSQASQQQQPASLPSSTFLPPNEFKQRLLPQGLHQ